jgi:hypothetical protein
VRRHVVAEPNGPELLRVAAERHRRRQRAESDLCDRLRAADAFVALEHAVRLSFADDPAKRRACVGGMKQAAREEQDRQRAAAIRAAVHDYEERARNDG